MCPFSMIQMLTVVFFDDKIHFLLCIKLFPNDLINNEDCEGFRLMTSRRKAFLVDCSNHAPES